MLDPSSRCLCTCRCTAMDLSELSMPAQSQVQPAHRCACRNLQTTLLAALQQLWDALCCRLSMRTCQKRQGAVLSAHVVQRNPDRDVWPLLLLLLLLHICMAMVAV